MGMSVSFYTHRFRVGMPEILLDSALRLGRPIVRMVRGLRRLPRPRVRESRCGVHRQTLCLPLRIEAASIRQNRTCACSPADRRRGRARLRFNLSRHAHSPEFTITWSLIKKASRSSICSKIAQALRCYAGVLSVIAGATVTPGSVDPRSPVSSF